MTTLRPLGPSVTLTASARVSTPRRMRSRASRANFTSLAAMLAVPSGVKVEKVESVAKVRSGLDDAEDVAFLHDQQVFTVHLDLGARPLAEQDLVAGLDRKSVVSGKRVSVRLDLGGRRII